MRVADLQIPMSLSGRMSCSRSHEHDNDPSPSLHLPDEAATLAANERRPAPPSRLTIYLRSDLGASKTTLTRGLLGPRLPGKSKSNVYLGPNLIKILE